MAKKKYTWHRINKISKIAKTFNTSYQNIHQQIREDRDAYLKAFDLYTTAVETGLKIEDMHTALIMYAKIKEEIKAKL